MLFALYFEVEGATRHITPYGWKQKVATVKYVESLKVLHDK